MAPPSNPARITLRETGEFVRNPAHARTGVPFPRGMVRDASRLIAVASGGRALPTQSRMLAAWPDGSAKWVLIDVLGQVSPRSSLAIEITSNDRLSSQFTPVRIVDSADAHDVDTGVARFVVNRRGDRLLRSVERGNLSLLGSGGVAATLTDTEGRKWPIVVSKSTVEERGPVVATICLSGRVQAPGPVSQLEFTARLRFTAGAANVQIEFRVWNPRAAVHPGGLWDLGDPGSICFKDLSISCQPSHSGVLDWVAERGSEPRSSRAALWSIYQDSSGGKHWNSPNHVDRNGELAVTFQGYRVVESSGSGVKEVARGRRANPHAVLHSAGTWVAVAIRDFWQTFPKALRRRENSISAGLFPCECAADFELQGGEQKRHDVLLGFGLEGEQPGLRSLESPLEAIVDPDWIEESQAVPWFTAAAPDDDVRYAAYIQQVVEGERSFFSRREIIDEYGWRNFGELYADHEAVGHTGQEPFVSHYNNQYDFIYGAFIHHLRTADIRWRRLMEEAARHSIDIDIYRTVGDRAAFNGGLFWHTDHYRPAATSTHRTYSRANAANGPYGGGPANEHNYSSGFLHYYFLTGDEEAALTVKVLAEWVIAMDDGALAPLSWIDAGPTGFASCTVAPDFHGPGRGAGNSINTLIDAFSLDHDRRYISKAEELIRRCIHPHDDVADLRLDDPEHRWSYLVFLQALGKYLLTKQSHGERDLAYYYARDSLLHYARWMSEHEVPYADVLHKVEFPTETWPAHDIRKSHVFHLAAAHASGAERELFAQRAAFFQRRCLDDLLQFPTAWLTRPLVILCVHGALHEYFRRRGYPPAPQEAHDHDFGAPARFRGQRERVASRFLGKLLLMVSLAPRLLRERWTLLRWRLGLFRAT